MEKAKNKAVIVGKNGAIAYAIRRSQKAKHLRIAITASHKVELVVPMRFPLWIAKQFILAKTEWIETALQKITMIAPKRIYKTGEKFPCLGDIYELVIDYKTNRLRTSWKLDGKKIILRCRKQADVKRLLRTWYEKEIIKYSKRKIDYLLAQLRLEQVIVRSLNARTRWGSCSLKTRTIAIHWRLALGPISALDYVIAHEVGHLLHPNHSSHFWKTVEKIEPNFLNSRKWLKAKGGALML